MKTVAYFVRHGESVANTSGILAGHMDVPLTPLGRAQARICAEGLRDVPLDAIYTSDLSRAAETARPHEEIRCLVARRTSALREFDAGEWTGMRYEDIARGYPDMYPGLWRESFGTLCPPSGESLQRAAERMYVFVMRCCEQHKGKTLLFVTHAGIFRVFWGKLMGIPPRQVAKELPFCPNASYSRAVLEGGELIPEYYGKTADEHACSAATFESSDGAHEKNNA